MSDGEASLETDIKVTKEKSSPGENSNSVLNLPQSMNEMKDLKRIVTQNNTS